VNRKASTRRTEKNTPLNAMPLTDIKRRIRLIRAAAREAIAEVFVSLRTRNNLSQAQLAYAARWPPTTVADIEGKKRDLRLAPFLRLLERLGEDPYRVVDEILEHPAVKSAMAGEPSAVARNARRGDR